MQKIDKVLSVNFTYISWKNNLWARPSTTFDMGLAIDFKSYISESELTAILVKQDRAEWGKRYIFFCWSNKENRMQLYDKVYWIYKMYSHENYFIDKVSMLHIYDQPQPAWNFTAVSKVTVHLCETRHQ